MRLLSRVVLCSGAMVTVFFGAPKVIYSTLDPSGVRLITPASPEYLPLLRSHANEAAMATLQPLLPYTVIAENRSGRAVAALAVMWSYKNEKGKPISGTIVHYTLLRDQSQMLGVGQAWVLTPVQAVNQVIQSRQFDGLPMADPRRQQEVLTDLARQTEIKISLDVIVFEDGVAVGPDRTMTATAMNGQLRAHRKLDDALRNMSPDRLQQFLSQNAALNVKRMPPPTVSPSPTPAGYEANRYQTTLKRACEFRLRGIGRQWPDAASLQSEVRSQPALALVPMIRRLP